MVLLTYFYRVIRLICIILLLQNPLWSQKSMRFQILSENRPVGGVHVANLVTEHATISDDNGLFVMQVSEEDLLVFSSPNYEYHRKIIEQADLSRSELTIVLQPRPHQLEEVQINKHPEINAVTLGIIPKPIKQPTPAERRLLAAGDFKWWHLIGIVGGRLPLEPIINAINGRTAMLKKEIIAERKTYLREKLQRMFNEQYFTRQLQIPPAHVNGFLFYAVENKKLEQLVRTENKVQISFLLTEIATEYHKIIKSTEAK